MLLRGELMAFDSLTWTATVRLWTSAVVVLGGVPVAHHLPAAQLVAGAQAVVLAFDPTNPHDAVVVATYTGVASPTVETTGHHHDSAYVNTGGDTMTGDLNVNADVKARDFLKLPIKSTVTIASGHITVSGSVHWVGTEGGAATDDLTHIDGGEDGALLILATATGTQVTTLKDGTGNLLLNGDFVLNAYPDRILLYYVASLDKWFELASSNNA